jgi:hypothetical protein
MGFGSLQHIQGFEVHQSRAMQAARSVPSSGFGYPLDGLRPRIPGRFCFAPAALMGFALRRLDLPESLTAFRLGEAPRAVSLAVAPAAKRRIGSASRGFWVYSLRKRRLPRRGFRPTTTSSSLGIHPSRVLPSRTLTPDLSGISSRTLHRIWRLLAKRAGASESRSALACLRPAPTEVGRPKEPLWGFRTCLVLSMRMCRRLGYEFTSHRANHHWRLTDETKASYRTLPLTVTI